MARIVINPTTFKNDKDALCVAFNEALRIAMEEMSFEPDAEPTDAQRKFFSDTDYADDELQLRRTILARICVFDTSVKDPTDEQLQEAVMFLEDVMQAGFPQNEWEQSCVQRMHDIISQIPASGEPGEEAPPPQEPGGEGTTGDLMGGTSFLPNDEERKKQAAALRSTGAYSSNGVWRTRTGQVIGDDMQAGQYLQALDALKGTEAYYDNGVFRTKDGKRIGGDLGSVSAFSSTFRSVQGTGAYFDGDGVWRTRTGALLKDVSPSPDAEADEADPNALLTPRDAKYRADREETLRRKQERERQREERDSEREERDRQRKEREELNK